MKTITNVEFQKYNKNRINIYLDNKFAFGLDYEIYLKYKLSKNMQLDDAFIEQILKSEDEAKALNLSLSYLSRRLKTEKEIVKKLNEKGYETSIIDKVISKLKSCNYIDDEQYCDKYIHDKMKFSKNGINKIKVELYRKGINKDIISQKISSIDKEEEYKRAYEIAEKKIKTYKETDKYKIRSKLFLFLSSKGFDFDTIKEAVESVIKYYL